MLQKINAEYHFIKEVVTDITRRTKTSFTVRLICYIDYSRKSYNIVQDNQEGLFFSTHATETFTNLAYLELAKEALEFVQKELYTT